MALKFALFTKGSKLPLNKGFKNMFELLMSCAQPSKCEIPEDINKNYACFMILLCKPDMAYTSSLIKIQALWYNLLTMTNISIDSILLIILKGAGRFNNTFCRILVLSKIINQNFWVISRIVVCSQFWCHAF